MTHAIVLLSGGLDSATAAAIHQARGHSVTGLFVHYGQRHSLEQLYAEGLSKIMGFPLLVAEMEFPLIKGCPLTDSEAPIRTSGVKLGKPTTYVPARNTVFLALALGVAEQVGADVLVLGAGAGSQYPDCQPGYMKVFSDLAIIATGKNITVDAPLIGMSKTEILIEAIRLEVPLWRTWSCYDPHAAAVSHGPKGYEYNVFDACGVCDACRIRLEAFSNVGKIDPLRYAQ